MEHRFNQLQCPLCGRSVSIRKFDPSDFVDDINGIRFEGLGYGRGFGVAEKGSILGSGDPVLDLIADRVLEISRFLMDAGIITEAILVYHLPVLESRAQDEELKELQESADGYEEEMDGLLAQVNEVLTEVYEEEFSDLESALEALIVEYHEAVEEAEDEEDEDEEDDEEHAQPMTDLERELQIGADEDNI